MVHLSQENKPQKVAWGIQPQLNHAIEHVSMIAQGIKKADKLSSIPLCDHMPLENSFKFLGPTKVFNKGELQSESGLTTWITPLNLPIWTDLWGSLPCQQPSLCLPDV